MGIIIEVFVRHFIGVFNLVLFWGINYPMLAFILVRVGFILFSIILIQLIMLFFNFKYLILISNP
jgi:hypothetical protein